MMILTPYRILVVDDVDSVLFVTKKHLVAEGYEVITCSDSRNAIKEYLAHRPDIIVLDVKMPEISGYEVAQSIRAMEAEENEWTPIIFLTSKDTGDDFKASIEAGGDDHIMKSSDLSLLSAKITALLRLRRRHTALSTLANNLSEVNQALERLTFTDTLTNLLNRRGIDEYLRPEWRRSQRANSDLAILMCDVDYFKRYNDCYGHPVGDKCLAEVARVFAELVCRGGDIVGRYGGEEFLLALPTTDIDGAMALAEKLCRAVAKKNIAHKKAPLGQVTISIGVATRQEHSPENIEQLIARADQALYHAKESGRNRASCDTPLVV